MNLMGKIEISSSNGGKCHVLDLPVLRKPDWYFQADNFSVRFEILNGNVLHGITNGKVKEDIIDPAVELQENVVRSTGLDSEPYYYVLGLAGIKWRQPEGSETIR